jgi:hypothetical protein
VCLKIFLFYYNLSDLIKNPKICLTMPSSTGNRIVAHARLLVNSVNIALNTMTTKIIVISDAPTIN